MENLQSPNLDSGQSAGSVSIKEVIKGILFLGASAIVPALIVAGLSFSMYVGMLALVIALAHALLIGLPLFLIGLFLKKIQLRSSLLAGFVSGAMPTAIFLWPFRNPELHSTVIVSGWGQIMVDGIPTIAGWFNYASEFTVMGLFGLSASATFWFFWKRWTEK